MRENERINMKGKKDVTTKDERSETGVSRDGKSLFVQKSERERYGGEKAARRLFSFWASFFALFFCETIPVPVFCKTLRPSSFFPKQTTHGYGHGNRYGYLPLGERHGELWMCYQANIYESSDELPKKLPKKKYPDFSFDLELATLKASLSVGRSVCRSLNSGTI